MDFINLFVDFVDSLACAVNLLCPFIHMMVVIVICSGQMFLIKVVIIIIIFFGIVDIMNFREGRLLGGLLLCRTGCVMSWDCLCKIGWYDHGCLLGLASQC